MKDLSDRHVTGVKYVNREDPILESLGLSVSKTTRSGEEVDASFHISRSRVPLALTRLSKSVALIVAR